MIESNYRKDIDGLRAISVLGVIGFHLFPNMFNGGFIGVDIFFVISGFVIAKTIQNSFENHDFNFLNFYKRRILRLYPCLVVVLITCLITGWYLLLSSEYLLLSKHVLGGLSYTTNIMLLKEAGYFDVSNDFKPLMHLWSLGIEGQFYLLWPFIFFFLLKNRQYLNVSILLILTISFWFNVTYLKNNEVNIFFSPIGRIWEFMFGVIVSVNNVKLYYFFNGEKNKILRNILALTALIAITITIFQFNEVRNYPGWYALIPVVSAALLITTGESPVNKNILSIRPLVFLGLISYPLYMWHWPIISFMNFYYDGKLSLLNSIVYIIFIIIISSVTYFYLEKRVSKSKKNVINLFFYSGLLLAVISSVIIFKNGFESRKINQIYRNYVESLNRTEKLNCIDILNAYKLREDWYCDLGKKDYPTRLFAFGDSHAISMLPALEKFAEEYKVHIIFSSAAGCPPLLGIQSMRGALIEKYNCKLLNNKIFETIKSQKIPNVLLIGRWIYYNGVLSRPNEWQEITRNESVKLSKSNNKESFDWGIRNTVNEFKDIGVNVIVLLDNPQQECNPLRLLRKSLTPGKKPEELDLEINQCSSTVEYHQKMQYEVNKIILSSNSKVIDISKFLCDVKLCPIIENSKFLYSDENHLSKIGAEKIYPGFKLELLNSIELNGSTIKNSTN
jgi:peptidoglycan/LPS O-acetylase OafA/YrhL